VVASVTAYLLAFIEVKDGKLALVSRDGKYFAIFSERGPTRDRHGAHAEIMSAEGDDFEDALRHLKNFVQAGHPEFIPFIDRWEDK
jgi:hypothetical protein